VTPHHAARRRPALTIARLVSDVLALFALAVALALGADAWRAREKWRAARAEAGRIAGGAAFGAGLARFRTERSLTVTAHGREGPWTAEQRSAVERARAAASEALDGGARRFLPTLPESDAAPMAALLRDLPALRAEADRLSAQARSGRDAEAAHRFAEATQALAADAAQAWPAALPRLAGSDPAAIRQAEAMALAWRPREDAAGGATMRPDHGAAR